MTTLADVQAKLLAAQNCHPNAVQTLIGEALDAIDLIARNQPDDFAKTEMWNPLYGGNQETAIQMAAVIALRDAEHCKRCADRNDGFYGSYAPPCPYHDDNGKPRKP